MIHGGIDPKNHYLEDVMAFNMKELKWTEAKTVRQSPGKICYHAAAAVFAPEREKSQSFCLFKMHELPTYTKAYCKIKQEGIYIFGGRFESGLASNRLRILKPGPRPLKWITPDENGPEPPARYNHTLSYYEDLNALVLFGGRNEAGGIDGSPGDSYFNDIWLYNLKD